MLIVIMLSVIMLSVIMPNVGVPLIGRGSDIFLTLLSLNWGVLHLSGDNLDILGRVFNFKLGRFASMQDKCIARTRPLLELKTRPCFVLQARLCPWL